MIRFSIVFLLRKYFVCILFYKLYLLYMYNKKLILFGIVSSKRELFLVGDIL